MKVIKYFGLFAFMSGQQMSVCIISNRFVLLFAPFLDLLVCLPLMQFTQVSKSAKSKVLSTPSLTNFFILSMEMCPNQSFKFRSVPAGTAGIFRSVPKTGTEHVIKNFAFCTVLFRPEWQESGLNFRNFRNGRNRGIKFSVLKFICLFCIFLY